MAWNGNKAAERSVRGGSRGLGDERDDPRWDTLPRRASGSGGEGAKSCKQRPVETSDLRRVRAGTPDAANEGSYAFESYCTSPPGQFQDVNTNVQWCSVIKTSLGSTRLILGGEVDCVNAQAGPTPRVDDFIELKTNMVITNERDEINFEK